MNEAENINALLEQSRNAGSYETDVELSRKLRLGALDDAFLCKMIGACEKYYPLMVELLDYPRRDHLTGTAALFRFSWWHNVYLELKSHGDGRISFTLYTWYKRYHVYEGCGRWGYFADCVISKKGDTFELYAPISYRSGEPVLYRSSCSPDSYRNMKYFVEHYTDEWLYKAMCKELRKRIKVKEYKARLRLNEVT